MDREVTELVGRLFAFRQRSEKGGLWQVLDGAAVMLQRLMDEVLRLRAELDVARKQREGAMSEDGAVTEAGVRAFLAARDCKLLPWQESRLGKG